MANAQVESNVDGESWVVKASGAWTLHSLDGVTQRIRQVRPSSPVRTGVLSLDQITHVDTAGVLLLRRLMNLFEEQGVSLSIKGLSPSFQTLFDTIPHAEKQKPDNAPPSSDYLQWIVALGGKAITVYEHAKSLVSFLGLIVETWIGVLLGPKKFRWTSFVYHIEHTGWKALPILGMLSFLIGVVLAYQGADQLRNFGADRYVVNLLGISILREIGVLLTAIIVAGRSGSAFTAQIGTMKVNQEVDAMQTLGLNPIELLVLPRIFALVIALPLLTFYSDAVGLLGGAIMTYVTLDIDINSFLIQLETAVTTTTLWVGLVKAPVFAFVIGMVGCYQGLEVTGSAESVGTRTTQAVVQAIFLVIVLDAFFSIAFSIMKI